jgi:hypothetical protein
MRRHRTALAVGGVILALVVVAVGALALTASHGTTPTVALGVPRYVEETTAAGIDQVYDGGPTFAVGGGVATFDCSGDRKPDLFLAGGSNPAALYRNDSPAGGALAFTRLTDPATDLTNVMGAYPIDIDGDGQVDLVVLRAGETVVLRGLGGCRFERGNERWSIDGGNADTTAFSASWEGSAALPTLALGRYLTLDASTNAASCADNALLRPNPAGTAYSPPIVLSPGYCSLSILFSDWDRSGRRDLRVTNDRQYYTDGHDQLWRIAPGEAPRLYTAADGWVSMQIWGMGIASYDVTGDGYPEYYLTSQGDNKLQTLTAGPAQPTYRDIALKRGVNVAQPSTGGDVLPSTSWHPEFEDVNNDGFADLFVSKGNVSAMPDYAAKDPSELLLGQPDGTFVQGAEAAGIVRFERGRGAAVADLNADGLPDLVEVFYGAPVRLWRNVGAGDATRPAAMGNWLGIKVSEAAPNGDAVGAWVEVQVGDLTIRREVTIGGGHIGGELGPLHVGLGSSGEAQVRVQWPDGEMGPWMRVIANQHVDIERGATEPRPWQLPKG